MRRFLGLAGGLALLALLVPANSFAAPSQLTGLLAAGQLPVSVTLTGGCTLGIQPIVFGTVDALSVNSTTYFGKGGVSVNCSECDFQGSEDLCFDCGANSANAVGASRAMTDGNGNFVTYKLNQGFVGPEIGCAISDCLGVACTQGISVSFPLTAVIGGGTLQAYGPAGPPAAGTYTDTVNVFAVIGL